VKKAGLCNICHVANDKGCSTSSAAAHTLGIVELCAKILQIMRNDFKDYARTFLPVMRTFFNSNFNQ